MVSRSVWILDVDGEFVADSMVNNDFGGCDWLRKFSCVHSGGRGAEQSDNGFAERLSTSTSSLKDQAASNYTAQLAINADRWAREWTRLARRARKFVATMRVSQL